MSTVPEQISVVTAVTKANVYVDGKVVSHPLLLPNGAKQTIGLIDPGFFHFGTDKPERMEIVSGSCSVKLDGKSETRVYSAGQAFEVPGKSGFDISVEQ